MQGLKKIFNATDDVIGSHVLILAPAIMYFGAKLGGCKLDTVNTWYDAWTYIHMASYWYWFNKHIVTWALGWWANKRLAA
jgi:hypothetical protein